MQRIRVAHFVRTPESMALVERLKTLTRKGGGVRRARLVLPGSGESTSQSPGDDDLSASHDPWNDIGPGSLEGTERPPGPPADCEPQSQPELRDDLIPSPRVLPETDFLQVALGESSDNEGVYEGALVFDFEALSDNFDEIYL